MEENNDGIVSNNQRLKKREKSREKDHIISAAELQNSSSHQMVQNFHFLKRENHRIISHLIYFT